MKNNATKLPDWKEVLNFLATRPLALASYFPLSDALRQETQTEPFVPRTDGILPLEPPTNLFAGGQATYLNRAFVFVDLCGYTAFMKKEGPEKAAQTLAVFRAILRDIAVRRDIRVAKWLGDGAMLVSVEPAHATALAVEIVSRFEGSELPLRAGVAYGPVLLFEGDDYLGEAVNLASRLCDLAKPGGTLCGPEVVNYHPEWVKVGGHHKVDVPGLGNGKEVVSMVLADGVALPGPIAID